jgi:hypothetical protein
MDVAPKKKMTKKSNVLHLIVEEDVMSIKHRMRLMTVGQYKNRDTKAIVLKNDCPFSAVVPSVHPSRRLTVLSLLGARG